MSDSVVVIPVFVSFLSIFYTHLRAYDRWRQHALKYKEAEDRGVHVEQSSVYKKLNVLESVYADLLGPDFRYRLGIQVLCHHPPVPVCLVCLSGFSLGGVPYTHTHTDLAIATDATNPTGQRNRPRLLERAAESKRVRKAHVGQSMVSGADRSRRSLSLPQDG